MTLLLHSFTAMCMPIRIHATLCAIRKSVLLFSGSSEYRHRRYINTCVKGNMGEYMTIQAAEYGQTTRLTRAEFMRRIMSAYAVLQLPGLGYDCYRIWEVSGY